MQACPESDLFRAVLFRMLCDALEFTGESQKSPGSKKRHAKMVKEARELFYDAKFADDLEEVVLYAGYDLRRVKTAAQNLIEAKQSGDHSKIPDFWRDAFRNKRMPSFNRYQGDIDKEVNG